MKLPRPLSPRRGIEARGHQRRSASPVALATGCPPANRRPHRQSARLRQHRQRLMVDSPRSEGAKTEHRAPCPVALYLEATRER